MTTARGREGDRRADLGGGYSTDAGALVSAGLRERNLIGTGIDASLNGVLAQRRSQIDLSVTDPYFLDRNLVAGFDMFHVQNNNQDIAHYSERRTGVALRLGYEFNEHLRQAWTYSLVDRNVYNVQPAPASTSERGRQTLLSQVGQTLTLDYRDSRIDPHSGFIIRLGTDFAGLGGDAHYVRTKLDGTYFIPLERSPATATGASRSRPAPVTWPARPPGEDHRPLLPRRRQPARLPVGRRRPARDPSPRHRRDSIGGRFIYTQSTELRFPLPISPDLGLTGRAFVDVGGLSQVTKLSVHGRRLRSANDATPRVGAGVGVSWKTPFGLINIDLAQPVVKQKYDQTQFFRFGFGTRF